VNREERNAAAIAAILEDNKNAAGPGKVRRMSGTALAAAVDTTPQAVADAIAYLRDNRPEMAILSSRRGYWMSDNAAAVKAWHGMRMRWAVKVITRTYRGALRPFLVRHDPHTVRLIDRDLNRIVEEVMGGLSVWDDADIS
jgi:hypothetical protein